MTAHHPGGGDDSPSGGRSGALEAALDRLARLQAVTAALSEAATPEAVVDVVLREGFAALGARAGSVVLVHDGGTALRVAGAVGYPDELVDAWQEFPIEGAAPLATSTRTGEAIWIGSTEELESRYPGIETGPFVPDQAFAAVPMTLRGRALGAVWLSFEGPRTFTEDEREFVRAIAQQCGQALERSRLLDAERTARAEAERAREQLMLLAQAGEEMAASLDYRERLDRLARLVVPRVADMCVVFMLEEGGEIVPVAQATVTPERAELLREFTARFPLEPTDAVGPPLVLRTGESQLYPAASDDALVASARSPEHLELLRGLAAVSSMFVPLSARDRTFGVLALATRESGRVYGPDDLALAEELARRASVAIDNARLFHDRTHAARTLQQALLPPALPEIAGIEMAARYRPAGAGAEVGGDFYDVFATGAGSWGVAVGDVCGKGIDAAAVAGVARHTVSAAAMRDPAPVSVLAVLNDVLRREGEGRFCTVVYGRLEEVGDGWRFTAASGGHPLPIVVRADGRVEPLPCPGTLLGVFADPHQQEHEVVLGPRDAVVLFTDGVTEARRGTEVMGPERLLALLESCGGRTADETAAAVEALAAEFWGDVLHDDLAVVVLRVTP